MHPLTILFIAIFFGIWTLSISSHNSSSSVEREVASVIVEQKASEGLDLQALPSIVSQAKSAEDLEKALNQPNGVNNLDLNGDGKTDFIKVTEYGDAKKNNYGFSLTTEVTPGEEQEIAQIEITKSKDKAEVLVNGNEQIYNRGATYSSFYPIGSFLLMSYLLNPHPFYYSPWRYGGYPSYYNSYDTRNNSRYQNDISSQKTNVRPSDKKTNLKSPNQGKTANKGIRKKLAKPTSSQKSFRSSALKKTRGGGFGSKRKGFHSRRSSSLRNFSGSRRGFGGFGK